MKTDARMLFAAAFVLLTLPLSAGEHPDTTGWADLFAPDLSNAMSPGNWTMKNGELVAGDHQTVWTKKSYGDFILDLEFKVEKDSNSGVFLRSSNPKNVLAALEIQVFGSADSPPRWMCGALFDCAPPAKNVEKPIGEWNRCTITCKGPMLTVILNGVEIIHVNLDDWKEPHKNPDGSKNKFPKALKEFARSGPIGLQGLHGKAQAPVYYRNLKIKSLE